LAFGGIVGDGHRFNVPTLNLHVKFFVGTTIHQIPRCAPQ
jgi:hypothetical protein